MRTNTKTRATPTYTHEGARAARLKPIQELRRSVMACLLWEDSFYEDGEDIGARIEKLADQCDPTAVAQVAVETRRVMNIRHAPLLLAVNLIGRLKRADYVAVVDKITKRADDVTELLSLYWKQTAKDSRKATNGKAPLAMPLMRALGESLRKFDSYQLSKYAARGDIRLRDVLRMTHPKPANEEQSALWKQLATDKLATADTWETRLSAGQDKGEAFRELLAKGKMGGFAILRNLRNMEQAGLKNGEIKPELLRLAPKSGILPYNFVSAARYVPKWERMIEEAMFASLAGMDKLPGKTALLVDHSRSMDIKVSQKSEISRYEAAAALGMMLSEVAEDVRIFTYSENCVEIPPRRGFGMLEALNKVRNPTSTYLGRAVKYVYKKYPECNRIIVITDEQSADVPPKPHGHGYIVNVSVDKPSIAHGEWVSLTGFSENLLRYIVASEATEE